MADKSLSADGMLEAPSWEDLGVEMVTIRVGTDRKPFVIHKNLLCFYSAYFRKAFNGSFSEAKDGVTHVEDTTVIIFCYFMKWLYTQTVTRYELSPSLRVAPPHGFYEEPDTASWEELIDLYVFADRYDVRLLRTDVVKAWQYRVVRWGDFWLYDIDKKAFDNLPSTSALCQYIARHYGAIFDPKYDKHEWGDWSDLPKDYTLEVMKEFSRRLDPNYEFDAASCDFHEHEDDNEKEDCKLERWQKG